MNPTLFVMSLVVSSVVTLGRSPNADDIEWQAFKQRHGKIYPTPAEEQLHHQCFLGNLDRIDALNALDLDAVHKLNKFADLCPEEFQARFLGLRVQQDESNQTSTASKLVQQAATTSSVDWRSKGAVTPVKDQGQCGSCWAFSTTGNIEGNRFLKTGQLTSLSEQELVDCASANNGCLGGSMSYAFDWVISNSGITTQSDYPYTDYYIASGLQRNTVCDQTKLTNVAATIAAYQFLPTDETQMASWVLQNGPVSAAVNANNWQFYSSGIYKACTVVTGTSQLNHGILIVGYGIQLKTKYWIIKNSWSSSWGEAGYIRVLRGTNCDGIALYSLSAV